jgi:hypothetical protein
MNKIKKDVLKYSLKKEYYILPPEVKLLTINFVDPEDHMSYFDILNKMDVTYRNSSRIQIDS